MKVFRDTFDRANEALDGSEMESFDSDHQFVTLSGVSLEGQSALAFVGLGSSDLDSALAVFATTAYVVAAVAVDGVFSSGLGLKLLDLSQGPFELAVTRSNGFVSVFVNGTLAVGPIADPSSVGSGYREVFFGTQISNTSEQSVTVDEFVAGDIPDAQLGVTKLRAVYDEEIPLVVEV